MAYTDKDIYYATNGEPVNEVDIFSTFAQSVDGKLNILQVVNFETNTLVTNTSRTTYQSSGLEATITPKFASSKILILATMPYRVVVNTGNVMGITWAVGQFRLNKNGTAVSSFDSGYQGFGYQANSDVWHSDCLNISYTDAPASTSPITYNISGKVANYVPTPISQSLNMNYAQGVAAKSSIMLLEVAQ